jgi:N utilization substance protein B
MQNIFAFKHCQGANYHLAKDLIKDHFSPDLNSMERPDPEQLNANKQAALELFENYYPQKFVKKDNDISGEVLAASQNAIDYYYIQVKKDADFLRKSMISGAEDIYKLYLQLLLLLVELEDIEKSEFEDKKGKLLHQNKPQQDFTLYLSNNRIIEKIRNHKELELESIRNKANWAGQRNLIKQWYRESLKDPEIVNFKNKKDRSFEEEKELILYVVKKFIFKNDIIKSYLEEQDQNWVENKAIVKSMVSKTIKGMEEDEDFELVSLSSNWDDDKDFFKQIFDQTIENDRNYEEIIARKTKNWDIDRIAALDKIILKMALNEMINFPSIPIKVTINEYIEISKNYSTPKSRQFINGILDVVAEELQKDGIIKKSGRGLIDNK